MIGDRDFRIIDGNTAVWVLFGSISQFTLGLITALALNRKRPRFSPIARVLILLPWVIPSVVAGHMLWLTHWADKDTQIMLMEKTGYVPSNSEAAQGERITKNPYYAAAINAPQTGTTAPQFPGQPARQSKVVLTNFQRMLLGEIAPAQGADALAKAKELEEAIAGTLK